MHNIQKIGDAKWCRNGGKDEKNMDYESVAKCICEKIGGKDNILSAAHCATRLRLVIADNKKCSKEELEKIEGVKGVFEASGQLQIIFGTGVVNKVYDALISVTGIKESNKEETKEAAFKREKGIKKLIKLLGDIFVPIIPAIVASGFLMGIMEALNFMANNGYIHVDTTSSIYVFAQIFSNAAYTFLPILIAFSAAKVFGGNPYLGAVIGMIMIHPSLQNAWTVATEGVAATQKVWFGLYSVSMVGYQGHVIPVIIAVWVMCMIEKRLHKIVPAMLDLFVTPLVSVFVTGYLTLSIIGPIFVTIENGILNGVLKLIEAPFGIGSFVMGSLYATTVVSGIHHMYTTIDIGQLGLYGYTYWLPLASAANVAQGAAALAVALKTRDKRLKSMALPSSVSAFLGITEPAIFGVNLRFLKPFIAGSIGGGCGALYASLVRLGATGTGVTGIFGILLHLHSPIHYLVAMGIAAGVAFILSWILYGDAPKERDKKERETVSTTFSPEKNTVYTPIKGEVILLSQVEDEIFSGEVLGKGIGIIPREGKVFAPFDGKVETLFDTKHAIGLVSTDGIALLIHVGINTVELNGEFYEAHVKEGDMVKAGQLLLSFDIEEIEHAGYDMTTPVVITNLDDYSHITIETPGEKSCLEKLMTVSGEEEI